MSHRPEPTATASIARPAGAAVAIGLTAAIVSMQGNEPQVLVVRAAERTSPDGLPSGPFTPLEHRTLEIGLRAWVREQTGLDLGYVEQLYTFGDRGRHARPGDTGPHVVSIGSLALMRPEPPSETPREPGNAGSEWRSWYTYFPWEDRRAGVPDVVTREILPRLVRWAEKPAPRGEPVRPLKRRERLRICFALDGAGWDEEKALERFELLYEAGLVQEARRDGREAALAWGELPRLGLPMHFDHRRILATAIGRLRAKIKYRPVIFELMPDEFTLFELQRTVEAISGSELHKQNFRRLVETGGLVEPTRDVRTRTGGRPARLYRFRREVLLERPAPGVRMKPAR